jgi:hypothetical protein
MIKPSEDFTLTQDLSKFFIYSKVSKNVHLLKILSWWHLLNHWVKRILSFTQCWVKYTHLLEQSCSFLLLTIWVNSSFTHANYKCVFTQNIELVTFTPWYMWIILSLSRFIRDFGGSLLSLRVHAPRNATFYHCSCVYNDKFTVTSLKSHFAPCTNCPDS